MEDGTEHIMTRVLPEVPVRQWVLSLPFQLRFRVAFDASLFSAIVRIFVDEAFRLHAAQARELGVVAKPNSGAVACLQRFGSALNLNPHVHLVSIDGVYVRDEILSVEAGAARLVFQPLPAPSEGEVHLVSVATCRRVLKLLGRRGLTDLEGLIPLDELDAAQQLAELAQRQPPLFAQVDDEGRVRQIRDQATQSRAGDVRVLSSASPFRGEVVPAPPIESVSARPWVVPRASASCCRSSLIVPPGLNFSRGCTAWTR